MGMNYITPEQLLASLLSSASVVSPPAHAGALDGKDSPEGLARNILRAPQSRSFGIWAGRGNGWLWFRFMPPLSLSRSGFSRENALMPGCG